MKLSACPHLIKSKEFGVFVRPKLEMNKSKLKDLMQQDVPDIEILLQKVGQETPTQIMTKYKQMFSIPEQFFSTLKNPDDDLQITAFSEFLKKLLAAFRTLKKKIKDML